MTAPDFNLLIALDVLLSEESVAGAARRLGLSASAMSRTLSRLRTTTGDPLLVRAGRKMVLTPHAEKIRDRTQQAVFEARSVLTPPVSNLNVASLNKIFKLRTNSGFVETFGPSLVTYAAKIAPDICLSFVHKPEKNSRQLREGMIDIEIGVLKNMGPEIYTRPLFTDRFIGVVKKGHLLAAEKAITPELYASCKHIITSRQGDGGGPVDEALADYGLMRKIAAVVPDFSASLEIARQSDLVALVPASFFIQKALTSPCRTEFYAFTLPVTTPEITVSQMWHPRQDGDAEHRWLRELITEVCRLKAAELHHARQECINHWP